MNIGSLFLSILLHLGVLFFIVYAPVHPPVDLTRPAVQVSLVMGLPGGENLPSPVLGHRPPVTGKQVLSTESAPKPNADTAPAATMPEAAAVPNPENLRAEEPEPEKKPEPTPEKTKQPEPASKPSPEKAPKPEEKQAESKSRQDQKSSKKGSDALADALADVRKQAKNSGSNTAASGKGSSSASRALADLEKQIGKTGVGGGGGQGDGPGGGGIYDVYAALVMEAVQPNWSMPVYSRNNLVVQVRIKLDRNGTVQDCTIERSSGRPEFDASAVNAVKRTGKLPKPPTPAQQNLLINFNSLEMMGR